MSDITVNVNSKYLPNYGLSGRQMLDMLNNTPNMIAYHDLYKVNNIDDILKNGMCIILYEVTDTFGHWTCILTHPDSIEFFDPYNIIPDGEINTNFMDKSIIKKYYKKGPKLRKLLYNSDYDHIEYNDHALQKKSPNIGTCGRHVIIRLLFRDLNIDDYVKLLKKNLRKNETLDDLVTRLTNYLW